MIPFNLDFAESNQCIDLGFGDVQIATKEVAAYTTGTVEAGLTGEAVTVEHGLGKTPSRIVFFLTGTLYQPTYTSSNSTMYYQSLCSDVSLNEEAGKYSYRAMYVITSKFTYYTAPVSGTARSYACKNELYCPSSNSASNLNPTINVNSINENTFRTPSYLHTHRTYRWIAFA